ncbi:MAG: helix-turn-helix transcriptional regulator [Actinobacteria bacterium]|nr:helix-turn-helix transcriptional regulator [Actinomycetota bacterium]
MRSGSVTLDSFLEFLVHDTLQDWSIDSVFVSVVRTNGAYYVAGGHGLHATQLVNGFERQFDRNSPGAIAYFDGKVEETGPFDDYPFFVPANSLKVFPNGFAYSLAVPVPSYGPLMIYCQDAQELDVERENFLYALGESLALHLDALGFSEEIDRVDGNQPLAVIALTPRQWEIHSLMLDGLSNSAIAHQMKYSESLIRQETMRIYKKLGITGRRDLPIRRRELDAKEA